MTLWGTQMTTAEATGSTPDYGMFYRYQGAPFGYSCKKILHGNGLRESHSGVGNGSRGIHEVKCAGHGGCDRCDWKLLSCYHVSQQNVEA